MTVRARWWGVGAAVLLLVTAGVGAGVLWVRRTDSPAAPTTVVLVAAGDEGADPFVAARSDTSAPATRPHLPDNGSAAAVTATVDPDTGARAVSGTTDHLYAASTPGNQELYGGSGSLSACDPAAIAEFLAAHPDKAHAWAGVRGIDPQGIARYLDTLTPVLLLHDTLVTNHGFGGGVATAFVSVLQAGTAVLVDATGLPVVRCACGNPLTAPPALDLSTVPIQGTRWDGYHPARALVVTAGVTVSVLVVVDVQTGGRLTVSVGVPAPEVTTSSAPTSAPTTAVGSACVLDLTWPEVSPGWIDPLGGTLTCQEMTDQWRRYEQWPGERDGSAQWVTFADGWTCTTRLASETTSAVGHCAQGDDRRFVVYQGQPGVQPAAPTDLSTTGTPAPATAETSTAGSGPITTTVPPGEQALLTPSRNIKCSLQEGFFSCTEDQHDFELTDHCENGVHAPVLTLTATGSAVFNECLEDLFVTVHWPDPTPYGTTVKLGDIACDVEQTGLTCTNLDGHGFTLSRAAYTLF